MPMDAVVEIVRRAGREILRWYDDPRTTWKSDRTPLTEADRAAHRLLARELGALAPGLPVLSEESPEAELQGRTGWRRFWCVDPLDGTKEFLKRSGEFTVNVALIEEGCSVAGVVHLQATGRTYRAGRLPDGSAEGPAEGGGAEMSPGEGMPFRAIRTRAFSADAPVLVASRDHSGPAVEALARALGSGVEFTSMGSSLKFCLVAEGRADLYLRDGPTMEWDTAAAQCLVERAGGGVYAGDGEPLRYNKSSLRNPAFLAVGDPGGPWRALLAQAQRTQ